MVESSTFDMSKRKRNMKNKTTNKPEIKLPAHLQALLPKLEKMLVTYTVKDTTPVGYGPAN